MNLIRLLPGRRRFLIAFMGSALALVFGRVAKAFDLIFQTNRAMASKKTGSSEKNLPKGIVVYFSGTGNTAKIARAIHRGMKSVIACDVAPIKKVKPEDMSKYDLIALGCPIWYFREPAPTKIFTHDMPRMDGKHCIIFGTHGAQPTNLFWHISRNILKKGMTIIGWNDWYGPDRILAHSPQPHMATGHPDEIDLMEAEAFGKRMAENSIRIYAGERGLIPEIPDPDPGEGEDNMWSAPIDDHGHITSFGPPTSIPKFDLTKCIFPTCTQCMGNCPVNAIDFSIITSAGLGSPLVIKEACASCGGICQSVCLYDAIEYKGEMIEIEIDMTKCTYPKCTLCADWCPQEAIDFSATPPVVHNWCESDNLCWAVCPEDAIIIINMAEIHLKKAWWFNRRGPATGGPGQQAPMLSDNTEEGEKAARVQAPMPMSSRPKYRPLIPEEDIGKKGAVMYHDVPRFVLNKEDWPYEVDEEEENNG